MLFIRLDIFSTLILAIFLFILGNFIKSKSNLLQRFCIPSPVVGGLLFAIISFLLRYFNLISLSMNTYLMDYFISLFFTIVGISISLSSIKYGGKLLIKYWILGGILAYSQNILALLLSKPLNIHPLLALMCGTISMEGGHGYSAAFGSTIESLGVSDAISVGITASTLGLILAGLIGAPVGKYLIEKHNLSFHKLGVYRKKTQKDNTLLSRSSKDISLFTSLEQLLIVMICVALGKTVSYFLFNLSNILVPSITWCIFISVLFRNINDKVHIINLDFEILDFLSEMFLGLFLTMALMSIDLFKLSTLLGPILVIVICQSIFIIIYSIFICFRFLGKSFDACIMISGLIGHGLGATPVALANMNSLCDSYGDSENAFLIVPLVAAVLLDIFTMPSIIYFIKRIYFL